ncbi:MAG: hypothetical protein PHO37_08845 [Kiritimatiellae bacterium]|nr:hypothetical protein [Kiritimatiellia bacterium]
MRKAELSSLLAGCMFCAGGVGMHVPMVLPELKNLAFGGLVQRVENGAQESFVFNGAVSVTPLPPPSSSWFSRMLTAVGVRRPVRPGAFLAAVDAESGEVLARGTAINTEAFQGSEIRFVCDQAFYVGAFSEGHPDIQVFVMDALSLKDSRGEERLVNGDMEESDTLLEPSGWQQSGASFVTLNGDFRTLSSELKEKNFPRGDASFKILHRPHTEELFTKSIESGDPLAVAGRAAKRNGVALYAWLDPFDDGRRALPPVQAWSSKFLEEHPEYRAVDQEGRTRWGLLCFGYPEVRRYKTDLVKEMLSYEGVAGVALKTHYQHNTIWDGNSRDFLKYMYNDVALRDYHKRWGKPADGVYDTYKLRMIYGGYVMTWLRELRPVFEASGKRLCLFQAPSSMLDKICGGWIVPPEKIISEKLCDDFLIEPRIHGDSFDVYKKSERMQSLVCECRQNDIDVGFDFWLPGAFGHLKADKAVRSAFIKEQLLAFSREAFDFIGIYEEMCLLKPDYWPVIGEASRVIQAAPPRVLPEPVFVSRLVRNLISVDKGGEARSIGIDGTITTATELIDGEDTSNSSVVFERWPVRIELVPEHVVRVNTVFLKGGHLGWENQCAPEDFKVEGLVDGAWRTLAEIKDAATRNKHDNTIPLRCCFETVDLTKLRVTVTRGSDSGKRYLVLREIEAFLEEK